MQRMKHLFFIFILTLVFASSAWSVDFNCLGGKWEIVSSQGGGTSEPPAIDCSVIDGSSKVTYAWRGCCDAIGNSCSGCKRQHAGSFTQLGIPSCGTALGVCPGPCFTNCERCYIIYGISNYEWRCPAVCTDGETRKCAYTGPAETEGKGMCRAGTQTCINGQWGSCTGEVIPEEKEQCDGKDHNCNEEKDEGACSCSVDTNGFSSANMSSGNLHHDHELFSTKGTGLTANLILHYNTIYGYNGPLGKGWTHTYNIFLKEYSDGSVLLRDGNERRLYKLSGNGYTSQSGDYSTLIKNTDTTFTITHKDGLKYNFNSDKKIVSIIDRNNNAITFTYANGNLAAITDPANRITTITYNTDNRINVIIDPNGNNHTFTYTNNMLTNASTGTLNWSYTYDTNSFILTKTDPNGYTTIYTYDTNRRVTQSTDPEGKTKSIAYPAADDTNQTKTTTVTEKDGGNWQYTYDIQNGTLSNKTDPDNNTTFYTYDANRNMLSKIDPDESATTYTYDAQGNMTSTTDALDQTTSYTYNSYGQIISVTNSDGTTNTYQYDTNGNLTSTTDSTGATTSYQYDSKGNITQITNASGQTTTLAYDQNNNLTSITDPTGAITSFAYDASGNMTTQTDASGATTRFEYNSLNQLIKTTDPQGNITVFAYDANGNKTSQTDANGNVTRYEYNYKGQLIKVTDTLGNITTYIYGGTGCATCGSGGDNLTSITDAKGNVTKYEYDTNGRLIKETDPLVNAIAYSYDAKGNLISKTDANGHTITYTYDSLNRLLKKTYPDTTTETYTYDLKGNILTAGNQYISYIFSYDANNRVRSVTDSNSRNINYEYSTLGNKTKLTYPEGTTVNYTYDNANRLGSIINGSGKTYSYQYDNLGRRTKLTMPNGTYTTYSYDNSGRLTNLTHKTSTGGAIDSFTYTHDKIGNRLTKAMPGNTATYTYDKIYRLLSSTYSNSGPTKLQNDAFTYDPVGNRLTSTPNRTYTYNNANQLINYKGQAYIYDKNGNLTIKTDEDYDLDAEIEGWTYQYDYENRLIKITKNEKNEFKTITFKYDPFGRRIEKRIEGVDKGIAETNTYTYVYDNEDIILEYQTKTTNGITTQETSKYIHGPGIDEPLALEKVGNIYYYHADGLGSITELTDTNGKVAQAYEYDAFGDLHDSMNAIKQPYTYTGREWDRETGLYYYRARYYDAKVGRFTSFDPILRGFSHTEATACSQSITSFPLTQPQKLHSYVYVENNAINLVDPTGLGGVLECGYYNNRCKETSGCDEYACKAYQCCKDWGEGVTRNCVRGCLINFDKLHCTNLTGEARNQCAALAHIECYGKCNALPLFIYPFIYPGMPASCKGII